jgi:hypothetical protein
VTAFAPTHAVAFRVRSRINLVPSPFGGRTALAYAVCSKGRTGSGPIFSRAARLDDAVRERTGDSRKPRISTSGSRRANTHGPLPSSAEYVVRIT